MNTQFEYLYRDASNYKSWHQVILEGTLTQAEKEEIHSCCDGDNFIAEQLGLPHNFPSDEICDDDHCWCEMYEGPNFGLTETDAEPTNGSVKELLEKFRAAKGKWEESKYDPWFLYA